MTGRNGRRIDLLGAHAYVCSSLPQVPLHYDAQMTRVGTSYTVLASSHACTESQGSVKTPVSLPFCSSSDLHAISPILSRRCLRRRQVGRQTRVLLGLILLLGILTWRVGAVAVENADMGSRVEEVRMPATDKLGGVDIDFP